MDKLGFAGMLMAWVLVIISVIWLALCAHCTMTYPGSIVQMIDRIQGVTRTYPPGKPFGIFLVSTVYLITYYFG